MGHALLTEVREGLEEKGILGEPVKMQDTNTSDNRKRGVGVLINTSFNLKGKPLVADALDALKVFCASTGKDLDYVLLEETWLFNRDDVIGRGFCSTTGVLDTITAGHHEQGPDN